MGCLKKLQGSVEGPGRQEVGVLCEMLIDVYIQVCIKCEHAMRLVCGYTSE